FETSIPTECVAAVPTASLPSASRCGVALAPSGPRGSVRGRGAPAAGPHSGSRGQRLIRCMRLLRPPGCRLNDRGKVTCETLHLTVAACRLIRVQAPSAAAAGELVVRRPHDAHYTCAFILDQYLLTRRKSGLRGRVAG